MTETDRQAKDLRARLDAARSAARVGTWVIDVTANTVDADDTMFEMYGLSPTQAPAPDRAADLGFVSVDLFMGAVHPDDLPLVEEVLARSMSSEGIDFFQHEHRVVHPDGTIRHLQVQGRTSRGEDGNVTEVIGSSMDVTEQRETEKSEAIAARFLMSVSDAIRNLDDADAIQTAAQSMLGEFLRASRVAFADVDHETLELTIRSDWTAGLSSSVGTHTLKGFGKESIAKYLGGVPFISRDAERDFQPGEGIEAARSVGAMATIAAPVLLEGRLVSLAIVHQSKPRNWSAREISVVRQVADVVAIEARRARAVSALHRSEIELRQLADAMPQMVWAARADGTVDYYNRRWYDYTGLVEGEIETANGETVIHPDDRDGIVDSWTDSLRTGRPHETECRYRRASDGMYRWHLSRALPARDAAGKIVRWFGTNTDTHDQKVAADEQREKKEALFVAEQAARRESEQASRMKDEFLATLSHELRTPLNAIVGWSAILRTAAEKSKALDSLKGLGIIERNARAQTQIIDDVLDMSRIVSGNLRLDIQAVDLSAIVRAGVETIQAAADAKSIRLHVVLDASRRAVSGDPSRLQQVFWNLLANAVKFTPKGGQIHVVLERVNSHVEVRVVDTGEGIAPEFLPFVFDRFRQADGSITRRHGGLGLGLSIVKQLVELHGGRVDVQSPGPGKGSTFVVHLPQVTLHAEPPAAAEAAGAREPPTTPIPAASLAGELPLRGVRVVVVDDEPDGLELVSHLLRTEGAEVRAASSAPEAWTLFADSPPDVLVSDLGMPGEDGYSLIRRIRALSIERGGAVPATALTAYARSADRVRVLESGFQMHLAKPVDPNELVATVVALSKVSMR